MPNLRSEKEYYCFLNTLVATILCSSVIFSFRWLFWSFSNFISAWSWSWLSPI